ncbi:MAG: succinate dehydrogenase, hydrophobic membrane anchor protein [Sphingomonadales bacterium]|nr:succinate dehydrogenase, hydrophobic membrane anchor protein [Sphingomonadales bacterium]
MSQRSGIAKVASGGTELGRVRGLGSAREGTGHFIHQRLTAVGNLALFLWLIVSLVRLPLADLATMREWLGSPLAAVPMILLIISVFWHIRLGLQTLIEDYVHSDAPRILALVIVNFYCLAGAAFGIFSVAKIAFTATAAMTGVPA